MNNIGIITFKETASGLASFFSMPRLENSFSVRMGEETYNFFLMACQYSSKNLLSPNKLRYLGKLCRDNGITLLAAKNKPARLRLPQQEIKDMEQLLLEIKAIKLLGALIRVSQKKDVNLLEKRIGFAADYTDFEKIDILSEEAVSIMVFEGAAMNEEAKKDLYMRVMESKGISIIFTKELQKLICSSDILIAGEGVDFTGDLPLLKDKVLLGENKTLKGAGISGILLWPEPMESSWMQGYIENHNDELLAVLRGCCRSMHYMDFLSMLPYIRMND